MSWGLLFGILCALLSFQSYINKHPNERLSRIFSRKIFSRKYGLTNQSRKELIDQVIFSFGAGFISLLIGLFVSSLATFFKLNSSLEILISVPFSLIAFALFIFGVMSAVTIPFAKQKNDS